LQDDAGNDDEITSATGVSGQKFFVNGGFDLFLRSTLILHARARFGSDSIRTEQL
jgi:hypothetical protein